MSQLLAIYKRELKSYFISPVAYVLIVVFLWISGFYFDTSIAQFLQWELVLAREAQLGRPVPPVNLNESVVRTYLDFIVVFVPIFLMPVLTMRLFAEEKKQGTMELLMTTPITDLQIVLGKFFAALTLYLVMISSSLLHIAFLYRFGTPDTGPILAGYLGLVLVGTSYLSLGLFVSTLTENQIVAAFATSAVSLLLLMVGSSSALLGDQAGRLLEYISIVTHFQDFQKGVVDTKDLVFFLTFTVFGVFLTLRSVESMRWRG